MTASDSNASASADDPPSTIRHTVKVCMTMRAGSVPETV